MGFFTLSLRLWDFERCYKANVVTSDISLRRVYVVFLVLLEIESEYDAGAHPSVMLNLFAGHRAVELR